MNINWFDKLIKWIVVLIPVVAAVVTIYVYFHKSIPKIEVQTISERLLTSTTQVEDLAVKYTYDSLEVHNLWQIQYVIRNVGDVTIVGRGADNMVIGDGVRCLFNVKNSSILSLAKVDDNFEAELNKYNIRFKQWRVNEFVELSALIESAEKPILKISDRDIRDSEIIYTQFNPTDNSTIRTHLFDCIPNTIFQILRIVYTIFVGSLMLGCLFVLFQKNQNRQTKGITVLLMALLIIGVLAFF